REARAAPLAARVTGAAHMATRPFFIVSAPRSGSTLLRLILDAHPRLAVPPPGWLFDMVYPYLFSYGDLGQPQNLLALAEDILQAPTVRKWPLELTPEALARAAREPTFAGIYEALHVAYAGLEGKTRWGEKTPRNSFWMDEIHALFPDAQFIHIVRDGRDQAIDISDSLLWPYSVYSGASLWQRYVNAVRDSAARLPREAFHEIRYEDLCASPEATIRRLCEFLGEAFDPSMLSPHETRSARAWSGHPLHAKTAQPISTQYCEMHRTRLSGRDVAALEGLIGGTLQRFGYSLSGSAAAIPSRVAGQLLESDTVTNPENVPYRRWHEERRKERKARGVWTETDRPSRLWGMN
ncbi:MAG TPA: sulfotransferase, partial [Burkholderiales bacterium]|nr:sulfotransferase [Burkholderiales bacterium]